MLGKDKKTTGQKVLRTGALVNPDRWFKSSPSGDRVVADRRSDDVIRQLFKDVSMQRDDVVVFSPGSQHHPLMVGSATHRRCQIEPPRGVSNDQRHSLIALVGGHSVPQTAVVQ